MKIEMVKVTPDVATEYLNKMVHNRKLNEAHVKRLAKDMAEGRWVQDASPIKFNTRGELVDGQHRLWSVIESGKTISLLVATDVPDVAFLTMDTGRMRNFNDILSIERPTLTRTQIIAAVTRLMYRWDKLGSRRAVVSGSGRNISHQLLWSYFQEHEREIVSAVESTRKVTDGFKGVLPQSILGLVWVLTHRLDDDDADSFFAKLSSGADLAEGDPIFALRSVLLSAALGGYREKHDKDVIFMFTLKAWNLWRKGDTVQRLVMKLGGANPEAFPEPI